MALSSVRRCCLLLALFTITLSSACTARFRDTTPSPTPEGVVAVDPLFREFYDFLGGEAVLGPAISLVLTDGYQRRQYTLNAGMLYDPEAPPVDRYRLAPLGLEMEIEGRPAPPPEDTAELPEEEHAIFHMFVPLYQRLEGERFSGKPLTEIHYNQETKSFEQYFENVGFTWKENDAAEHVKLLPYGSWKCTGDCRSTVKKEILIHDSKKLKDEIFSPVVSRLGQDLTGFALTEPTTSPDGKTIVTIYENLVLIAEADKYWRVSAFPLAEELGIASGPLVPPSGFPGMYFWPIEEGLGYNVPQPFVDYIAMHGGTEISGPPIGELAMMDDLVFTQCFKNLCLEYLLYENLPTNMRIRAAPLGYEYHKRTEKMAAEVFSSQHWQHAFILEVDVRYPFLQPEQVQEITALVFEANTPKADVKPILVLDLPNGQRKIEAFTPTDSEGFTSARLSPGLGKNGEIIGYHVCAQSKGEEYFCTKGEFVIWQNP